MRCDGLIIHAGQTLLCVRYVQHVTRGHILEMCSPLENMVTGLQE